jgi:hypothetical protein
MFDMASWPGLANVESAVAYDAYRNIPSHLKPTFADGVAITEIAMVVKEAVKVRHDFHTAIQIADWSNTIKQEFVPAIARSPEPPPQKHLNAPPPWESGIASLNIRGGRTLAGLAVEHDVLKAEAVKHAARIRGNEKLSWLIKTQLDAFFPDIGYSAATGTFLRRLRKDKRNVLDAFQPLGVEDAATVILLLQKRKNAMYYYW